MNSVNEWNERHNIASGFITESPGYDLHNWKKSFLPSLLEDSLQTIAISRHCTCFTSTIQYYADNFFTGCVSKLIKRNKKIFNCQPGFAALHIPESTTVQFTTVLYVLLLYCLLNIMFFWPDIIFLDTLYSVNKI